MATTVSTELDEPILEAPLTERRYSVTTPRAISSRMLKKFVKEERFDSFDNLKFSRLSKEKLDFLLKRDSFGKVVQLKAGYELDLACKTANKEVYLDYLSFKKKRI